MTRRLDELEKPDFDGRQFTAGETEDDWPSRAHGWALVLVVIFIVVGLSSWRAGSVIGAVVFFGLAAGVLALAGVMIRRELRKFMRYRHRL